MKRYIEDWIEFLKFMSPFIAFPAVIFGGTFLLATFDFFWGHIGFVIGFIIVLVIMGAVFEFFLGGRSSDWNDW